MFNRLNCVLATLTCALLVSASVPADAVVVRHDVPDAAYLGQESEYPAIFSLYRTRAGHRDCLATLIGPRHALTAGHCTDVRKLRDAIGPNAKGYALEIAGREAWVEAVIEPPVRPDGTRPDIAILRLRHAVEGIQPLAVYEGRGEAGRIVRMPGWGGAGTGQSGAKPSDGLLRVAENRVDRAENGRLYWVFDAPESGKALTLEGIHGPGDSGGPALLLTAEGWRIAGVSSAQRNGGGPEGVYGVEEIFVRTSDLGSWINANTR